MCQQTGRAPGVVLTQRVEQVQHGAVRQHRLHAEHRPAQAAVAQEPQAAWVQSVSVGKVAEKLHSPCRERTIIMIHCRTGLTTTL